MDNIVIKLVEFEKQERWQDAIQLLYIEWKKKPLNLMILMRLICESWYVIVMWDCCIPSGAVSYDECERTLFHALRYGNSYFNDNAHFLCIVGYIITLIPDLFTKYYGTDNIETIEHIGRNSLYQANKLLPHDPFCAILYSGFTNDIEQHRRLQQEYSSALKEIKWDESRISHYFYNILVAK